MLKERSADWTGRPGGSNLSSSRLLLVDDDPALLLALSGTLQNRLDHCIVDACESGMQALDFVKARTYATIVSDVTMPDMNGWQFLKAVKELRVETPVFLMSGSPGPIVMEEALAAGASGFFAKPFDRDHVVATIRQGMELSGLDRMIALEESLIRRAQSHRAPLVEKLHQHDGAYGMLAAHSAMPERSQPVDPASTRQAQYRSTVVRHVIRLDKLLRKLTELHRGTSSRRSMVQDNIRRHALTRVPATS